LAGVAAAEIAHDAVLLGVLDELSMRRVRDLLSGAGVVVARVGQAEGVPELVHDREEAAAADRDGAGGNAAAQIEPEVSRGRVPSGIEREGAGAVAGIRVVA